MLEFPLMEAAVGVGELERPQKVAGLFEVGTHSENLVDQVFHADHAIFTHVVLDELVVGESNALLVDLAVPALVDELTNGLQIGIAVGNVRVDDGEHLLGGLGQSNKDAAVYLDQTEELEDLARLGSNLVDTVNSLDVVAKACRSCLPLDSDNEDQFRLLINKEVTLLSAQASKSDLLTLRITVFLDIGLGTLEDGTTLLLVGLRLRC